MGNKTPYWLHPNDPRYWEHQEKQTREMRAHFEETKKPLLVTLKISAEDKFWVEQAIRLANQFYGTQDPTKAMFHICMDFLKHGPHERHLDAMAKNETGKAQEDGPGK